MATLLQVAVAVGLVSHVTGSLAIRVLKPGRSCNEYVTVTWLCKQQYHVIWVIPEQAHLVMIDASMSMMPGIPQVASYGDACIRDRKDKG